MYRVEKNKLMEQVLNEWIEVIRPAVLFDVSRDEEVALPVKRGTFNTLKDYQYSIEKSYMTLSIEKEFVLIDIEKLTKNVNEQSSLMNYIVDYTNTRLAYDLATVSYSERKKAAQDILEFQERVAV